jgi:hypothetical protein
MTVDYTFRLRELVFASLGPSETSLDNEDEAGDGTIWALAMAVTDLVSQNGRLWDG